LTLRFNESNEIDWIEALGAVRILNEGREAVAEKAVFDVKTDEFLLEENPKLIDGKNILMGDRIRFWRSTGRMVCEPARAVIFPGTELKTEFFEK
jgi:lipopolysaccharide export system protein LptA